MYHMYYRIIKFKTEDYSLSNLINLNKETAYSPEWKLPTVSIHEMLTESFKFTQSVLLNNVKVKNQMIFLNLFKLKKNEEGINCLLVASYINNKQINNLFIESFFADTNINYFTENNTKLARWSPFNEIDDYKIFRNDSIINENEDENAIDLEIEQQKIMKKVIQCIKRGMKIESIFFFCC